MNRKNLSIALITASVFIILYIAGVFSSLSYRVYDVFLRFRADRERYDGVVFLNIDDNAIAHNGVFPWPRSITADALLRLKEYGAEAVIFDIEYIDRGPQGIDTMYLNHGMPSDFRRSFSEINSALSELIAFINSGRGSLSEIEEYSLELSSLIRYEQNELFRRTQNVARDNDLYLVEAAALSGRTWVTLNLRQTPLHGEQAERRQIAEERFSYPVIALPGAFKGKYIDILPPLPALARAALGAGFTNVEIDRDGIRRRVDLAQNIHDNWYLQLSFAPLMHYLGNPDAELSRHNLRITGAKMPDGEIKDIAIPLDGNGRMLLDWPKENYFDSYDHISFYNFSLLDDIEAELEIYSRALLETDIPFFARFDPQLHRLSFIASDLAEIFDAVYAYRNAALVNTSDEFFDAFIHLRKQSHELIRELLSVESADRIRAIYPLLIEQFPEAAAFIEEEADYIISLAEALEINLNRYESLSAETENMVKSKFIIMGRVDTGTTDIGANPFHAEYINVGTHAVVLDMILSETFITPIGMLQRIFITVVITLLFFSLTGKLQPTSRAAYGFLLAFLIVAIPAMLFRFTGIFFNPLLSGLTIITAVLAREIVFYASSEREKQFIRKALSTYVSNDVVKELIEDPSKLQLGGTERHITALFSDIKGFSAIAEQLTPAGLVTLLNRYLSSLSDVILLERGTIDKYIGDAIVAFFGAPVELPDHAIRACTSAVAMKKAEMELNKKIAEENLSPMPIFTRIGINTGSMVAGNMGTENKMNYTIMGNAVNLAARLEGVNKQYGTYILASEAAISETNGLFLTRRLDRIRAAGMNEPVQIYEIIDIMADAQDSLLECVQLFHNALLHFENRSWKIAEAAFSEVLQKYPEDAPTQIYLERCRQFNTKPPASNWDGVYNITEK